MHSDDDLRIPDYRYIPEVIGQEDYEILHELIRGLLKYRYSGIEIARYVVDLIDDIVTDSEDGSIPTDDMYPAESSLMNRDKSKKKERNAMIFKVESPSLPHTKTFTKAYEVSHYILSPEFKEIIFDIKIYDEEGNRLSYIPSPVWLHIIGYTSKTVTREDLETLLRSTKW